MQIEIIETTRIITDGVSQEEVTVSQDRDGLGCVELTYGHHISSSMVFPPELARAVAHALLRHADLLTPDNKNKDF
jgi:hypothetical protein